MEKFIKSLEDLLRVIFEDELKEFVYVRNPHINTYNIFVYIVTENNKYRFKLSIGDHEDKHGMLIDALSLISMEIASTYNEGKNND